MDNLAAKYRPRALSDVVEQDVVVSIVKNICQSKEITNRNFLFIGPAGCGKALKMTEKLLTTSGFKLMRDIQIGDELFTGNEHIGKVKGIYPQGVRPMYKITLSDETSIEVSDEHLNVFYTFDVNGNRVDHCMTTTDLIDFFCKSDIIYFDVPFVPWSTKELSIHPYVFGFLVDSVTFDKETCSLDIYTNKIPDVSELNEILEREYDCKFATNGFGLHLVSTNLASDKFDKFISYIASISNKAGKIDRIPDCYLKSDCTQRISLLEGIIVSQCNDVLAQREYVVDCNNNRELSDDFSELVRSLGIVDFTAACPFYGSLQYKHLISINGTRHVKSIDKIEDAECQCIEVDHLDKTFIVGDGFIVTHNTTTARIIANALNDNQGSIIEIDAASHSGVESMREIMAQAKTYPVGSKYKVFIIDECVTGDTEILTDEGFKRIDSLSRQEKVAQYTQDGNIEFVEPEEYVSIAFEGDAYRMFCRNGKNSVLMSPHHVQPQRMVKSNRIIEEFISDAKFSQSRRLIVSGKGTGCNNYLSSLDRLAIAAQADGCMCPTSEKRDFVIWQFHLKLSRKVNRLENLAQDAHIDYNKYQSNDDSVDITLKLPRSITKEFNSYFSVNMGYDRACQFIEEILFWDGSTRSGYPGYYSSIIESNVSFVSAVLAQCKCSANQKVETIGQGNHHTLYSVNWYYTDNRPSSSCSKKAEYFKGNLYCVKVPSKMIVIRAQGFTFISGNCHAFSQAAWQSALLTIESQPAMSIFCWCTTNPEKIPATILSRVQTFQLSKISLDGIYNRLKYIIEQENKEGAGITYDDDAILFLAKTAQGGMRAGITALDKALMFDKHVTIQSLEKSLGLPNYDEYFEMLNAIAKKDNAKIVSMINSVYNSGVNFVKWFDGFFSFITNIVKYIYIQDINATMIPSTYADKISKYNSAHAALCLKLSNKLVKLNQELKTTQYLQELAISYLCTAPVVKK